jgi:serine/threonine-protein kinase
MARTAQVTGTAAGGSWQRMAPWLVVCAVLIAAVVGFLVWNVKPPARLSQPLLARFKMELPPTQRLSDMGNHVVALSPDGQRLVYAANDQLYLRAMDQLEATPIPGTDDGQARSPFFSPDGQWVGFWAGGQLKKVSISGGTPVTLCETSRLSGVSWGTDEWIVFAERRGDIFRVSATGGNKELLISIDREKGEQTYGPQILPGGDAILFTVRAGGSWDDAQIVVQSLETGERTVLINGGRDARHVRTGHLVYARGESLFAVPFDPRQLEVTGGGVPIMEGVKAVMNTVTGRTASPAHFSFSDLGTLVYVPDTVKTTFQANLLERLGGFSGNRTLVWTDRTGQEEALDMKPGVYFDPRISPDGSRVALTVVDADNWDVWIYDLGRHTANRLTFDPAVEQRPAWTPDSRRVAFGSDRGGESSNLFWKAADGTGAAERLTTSPYAQRPHFWLDDKKLLFEEVGLETRQDLHLLLMGDETTSRPLLNTQFTEDRPAISPDDRWIAYRSDESGQSEIYVRPFPNLEEGKWLISRGGGTSPIWGPNGRELFYRGLNEEEMMIVRIETEPTFTYTTPEILFAGDYFRSRNRNYDISPDGQRFLMLKEIESTEEISASTQDSLVIVQNWFEELKRLAPTN